VSNVTSQITNIYRQNCRAPTEVISKWWQFNTIAWNFLGTQMYIPLFDKFRNGDVDKNEQERPYNFLLIEK
jgi:hypothetical protein